jgi:hypothetical protein
VTIRRWRSRRQTRDTARSARRAEAEARHATLIGRIDALERRVGGLDETVAKQLAELEPRLMHGIELRSRGLERELASLAQRAEAAGAVREVVSPQRATPLAPLLWVGGLALGLGALLAQTCAG